MSVRECRINRGDLVALMAGAPGLVVAKLKASGFVFERETCPVKIAEPWSSAGDPETGELIYYQSEEAGHGAG